MKSFKAILAGLFLMLATPVMAQDSCMTASWYDPNPETQLVNSGINLEVLDDVVVGYYYYPGAWFTMLGDRTDTGIVNLTFYQTTSRFGTRAVGDAELVIIDNDTLIFSYHQQYDWYRMYSPETAIPWCIGCSGSWEYTRLTQPVACE